MNFIDQVKQIRFQQKITFTVIFVLLVIVIIQSLINMNLADANNRSYRISIPPSLEFGVNTTTDTKTLFEIYQFAGYIEQQIYFWQQDGNQDFKENIDKLYPYITPKYREYLLKKHENLLNLGQLTGREKNVVPINDYRPKFVKLNAKGWEVRIDFQAQEFIKNKRFKNKLQRHFVQVVLRDINPEINKWGLQIDAPTQEIKELLTVPINKK